MKKAKRLILDAGAFINKVRIWEYGEEFYTVDEITFEIRNKDSKDWYHSLPVEVKCRQPSAKYIQIISEVSKKTGDYATLSVFDTKLLALTLQLEVEAKGNDNHLNFNIQKPETVWGQRMNNQKQEGFYMAKSDENDNKNVLTNCHTNSADEVSLISNENENENLDSCKLILNDNKNSSTEKDDEYLSAEENEDEFLELEEDYLETDKDLCNLGDNKTEEDIALYDENSSGTESINDLSDENSEDDDGWITPSNISKMKKKREKELYPENENDLNEDVETACMSSDFAIQNVLKHIKLPVMSTDGKFIHQLKTFILRCHACFKTTSNMSKVFCPYCGHKTLKRVSVTMNPDGSQKIWISTRRRINTKGQRFSLPMPKGGKHAANPILVQDQRVPQQKCSKKWMKKTNPLDPDYDAADSPFVKRDVYSRAGQLGLVGGKQQGKCYWDKRNPNVSNKSKGKKKRS